MRGNFPEIRYLVDKNRYYPNKSCETSSGFSKEQYSVTVILYSDFAQWYPNAGRFEEYKIFEIKELIMK